MSAAFTVLAAEYLRLSYGERVILGGVSLQLARSERVAVLGRNGAGKTTLLRLLAGQAKPEEGMIWQAEGSVTAVLEQHPLYRAGLDVAQLVTQANPYQAAFTQLRELERDLSTPQRLDAWNELHHRLEVAQAYGWPARAARTLSVLDLSRFAQQGQREAATLSGGERTRLGLALALLQEGDVLLLDEPTNHLDIRMREWLETWLLAYPGAVMLTSHDREFLDKVAVRSLWVEGGQLTSYPGGYTRARTLRDAEKRAQGKAARLGQRELGRLRGSAERLDVWGKRSKAVKSRAQRVVLTEAPAAERAIRMKLLAGQSRAPLLLWGEHLNKRQGSALLRDVALKVRQGDRIALMGANGSGKTTLLNLLSGVWQPDPPEGEDEAPLLRLAPGVTLASLDQLWHGLNPHVALHLQFERRFGAAQASALLGRAGFVSTDWPKLPTQLSGGERARAGLALISSLRADLLLLDEPTNHLDVEALEALETAVHAYSGAVIIVTHDRRFAREVSNRLWFIEQGRLTEVSGWGRRERLDPARTLSGDPPPPPPPPSARMRMGRAETRALELDSLLAGTLTGREEARLRAERHHLRAELLALYAEVYAAPLFDEEVREVHLRVRAQRFETGAMFWAASNDTCPHLAWDGHCLRWNGAPPAWFGAALLAGTLRILFERWDVGRVQLGPSGRVLSRRQYFEKLGYVASTPAASRVYLHPQQTQELERRSDVSATSS